MHEQPTVKREQGTILIVDDDDGVRKVLTRWIGEIGHFVVTAASAEEALNVLSTCEVDLALCDVQMPGQDGIWLAERLRRQSPTTGVAFVTGISEMDPKVTLRPGIIGYIVKPFDRNDLEKLIQRGLAARGPLGPQVPGPRLVWDNVLEGAVVARS